MLLEKLKLELKEKKRELAIEASLERVRGVAMAMKKPEDMLDVCRVISKELEKLGINEIRNVQTAIVNKEKATYLNYEYFSLIDKTFITPIAYQKHPDTNRFVRKMLRDPNGFFTKSFKGREEVREWIMYQSGSGQFVDPASRKANSLNYYFYSIGPGALGISTYAPLNKEEIILFKRFRNVFLLSYQRFIDIQTAEAQAREVEIQLSLERVRARALAMHKSEELTETSAVLFHELNRLGIHPRRSGFGIYNEDQKSIQVWLTTTTEDITETAVLGIIPINAHPVIKGNYTAWKQGKQQRYNELKGDAVKEYYQKIGSYMSIAPRKKYPPRLVFNVYFFSDGSLNIMADDPITEEQNEILIRFAKVFDLTYRRFLDLQKAEKQAREAQIEAALERVRGKALAMHKSEELHEVVTTLKKELTGLNISGLAAATLYLEQDKERIRVVDLSTGAVEGVDHHMKLDKVFKLEDLDPKLWIWRIWNGKQKYFVVEADEADFKRVVKWLYKVDPAEAKMAEKIIRENKIKKAWLPVVRLEKGRLNIDLLQPPTPEIKQIMLKLGAGFDLAYRRFLDLQKAEAQAREAQIELGLEKVRARAMAMHKSQEVMEVAGTLFEELQKLGFTFGASSIIIMDKDSGNAEYWIAGFTKNKFPESYRVSYFSHPYHDALLSAWKTRENYLVYKLEGNEKKAYDKVLFSETAYKNIPSKEKKLMKGIPSVTFSIAFTKHGALHWGPTPLSEDEAVVLKRFAQVFEQSYTRFLDLQNAEAQAREAQVEASLERMRAKAMAMHKTDELLNAAEQVHQELSRLGINSMNVSYAFVEGEGKYGSYYSVNPVDGRILPVPFLFPHTETRVMRSILSSWKKEEPFNLIELDEKATIIHQTYIGQHIKQQLAKNGIPFSIEEFLRVSPKKAVLYTFNFSKGYLFHIGGERLSSSQEQILLRTTRVFEQTFTRFLDLQKAEAQAREAQIETALEKVRTHTMGMRSSNELANVAAVMFDQMKILGGDLFSFGIVLCDRHENMVEQWHSLPGAGMMEPFFVPVDLDYIHQYRYDQWKAGVELFSIVIPENYISEHFQLMMQLPSVETEIEKLTAKGNSFSIPSWEIDYGASFSHGYLLVSSFSPFKEDKIFPRFAKVFEQAYTRFLDLQKAEEQAMEAKVEASLERVRTIAMGMKQPADMLDVCRIIADQLQSLSISDIRNVQTIIIYQLKYQYINYQYFVPYDKNSIEQIDYRLHPVESELTEKMLTSEDAFYFKLFEGEELQKWRDHRKATNQLDDPMLDEAASAYYYFYSIGNGALGITTYSPLNEETLAIFKRFRNVFELAYKRYIDIELAEAQAREAKIETALERVRARALAMQAPDELIDVAQVLRNEMGVLGIEELETASIYIHEKDSGRAECWFALKEPVDKSNRMVADQFMVNLDDTWVGREMKKFYLSGDNQISIVMKGARRKEWIEYCYSHSPAFNGYYGQTIPDRTYHLYKFSHGYIGAAAPGDISTESWRLLSRAASVFSLAYSRFKDLTQARNDLKRLKEEKQRAESALAELKATQTQLIQSEKMASLGEMTAGIAHEIQNPLNFVNNFSEVSSELISEMKEQLEKGNNEAAIDLVEDVKHNLEKINIHGKRADSIVKSMLQHSRSSAGQKEPTDINALVDEYLRLAFHGFRAKDPSFNTKFETDLDNTIEKINLVPQEIGRVMLNLVNNAFYAVTEKRKENLPGYEPIVKVSTLNNNGSIEIRVQDNGNGIPIHVVEKIFQPFFTTKPTGQGTGLGLSLSYDIITKGHGGELKVNTKEGEGSEFVIQFSVS